MAKRKKRSGKSKQKTSGEVDPRIKKTILGIILISLGILWLLAVLNVAGDLGEKIDDYLALIFGVGRFFIPFGLIFLGFKLFKKKSSFSLMIILGGILIFISFWGLLHFFHDADKYKKTAQVGEGGGLVGYKIANPIYDSLGLYGGAVVLLTFLTVGFLLAFHSYISEIMNREEEVEEGETETVEKDDKKKSRAKSEVQKSNIFVQLGSIIKGLIFKAQQVEPIDDEKSEDDDREEQALDNRDESVNVVKINSAVDDSGNKDLGQNMVLAKQRPEWILPATNLLQKGSSQPEAGDINENSQIIQDSLANFGITAEVVEVNVGPTVTQYSVKPAQGVRLSKIVALQNDLSMALAAHPLRIEAPIPGKSLVGIEIPNHKFAIVRLRSVLESKNFQQAEKLPVALGQDASGKFVTADITAMPHLLIAGATGAGKSIGIADIIISFLYKYAPEDLRLILIDPKRVELSVYNGIPHLLTPVIVEVDKMVNALKWAVNEMERRYRILQEAGTRDLDSYNDFLKKSQEKQQNKKQKPVAQQTVKNFDGISHGPVVDLRNVSQTPTNNEQEKTETEEQEKLPYIVIVIDELADIMVSHGKEVEVLIVRIAQKARAVGIHLILSTQRPSVQVITGLIKANIPARIAYQVASQIDSRTILDMAGAEKLLGKGDMLFLGRDTSRPVRIQGAFIQEKEIKKVVKYLKKQADPNYDQEILQAQEVEGLNTQKGKGPDSMRQANDEEFDDDLFPEAKETVIQNQKASATLLQRKLRIGYARAARIMEMLEEAQVIGPAQGAKPREILIKPDQEETIK
ncbi:MAG: hypothetical protein GF332_04455 [Candidatus Moranbacteria bacterium]|nr:hypothetical protein [Candidatus Moranbacteria bacterium]